MESFLFIAAPSIFLLSHYWIISMSLNELKGKLSDSTYTHKWFFGHTIWVTVRLYAITTLILLLWLVLGSWHDAAGLGLAVIAIVAAVAIPIIIVIFLVIPSILHYRAHKRIGNNAEDLVRIRKANWIIWIGTAVALLLIYVWAFVGFDRCLLLLC